MLNALDLHLNHHEERDTIARAGIMFVRFPALVDELLSEPSPPHTNPAHVNRDPRGTKSPWFRPDVQQLLRHHRQDPVDIAAIARCFGRDYAPATVFPAESSSPNGHAGTPNTIVNVATPNLSPADKHEAG